MRYHGTTSRVNQVLTVVKLATAVPSLAAGLFLSWWPPAPAEAQAPERSVLRQLYGDVAVEARTRGQGTLNLGVADGRTSIVVAFMATDLRRWSDSATRVLAARPRRGATVKWEAVVSGPGITAGSMSLARNIAPGDTSIVLLVTDTAFRAVRTSLSLVEARALAAAVKRAAGASLPTRPAPLPKRPPARKPPPAASR